MTFGRFIGPAVLVLGVLIVLGGMSWYLQNSSSITENVPITTIETELSDTGQTAIPADIESGKRFVSRDPRKCEIIRFTCEVDEKGFSDETGCGCIEP